MDKLSPYLRLAGGGNYLKLEHLYFLKYKKKWYTELHKFGNTLDNNKLEFISKYGLFYWYLENLFPYSINYDFRENSKYFLNNIEKLNYYDFKKLYELYNFLTKDDLNYFSPIFEFKCSYIIFLEKNINKKIPQILFNSNFFTLIKFFNLEGKINKILLYLNNIFNKNLLLKDEVILEKLFCDYPYLKNLGIIFHKFKIILEKTKDGKNIKQTYDIDKFLEIIQNNIYLIINTFVKNNIFNKKINFSNNLDNILENKKLLNYYDDNNLLTTNFIEIINRSY